MSKLFDFVIGNPPYQSENPINGRQPPVYNIFMDAVYPISDVVELITPARFLSNAGQTKKDWNRKMLNDEHFKVLKYEADASKVFPNAVLIRGGVAITLRDEKRQFGKIGVFTPNNEVNSILNKVLPNCTSNIADICIGAVPYKYTDALRQEHPEYVELAGRSFDLRTNTLDKLKDKIFFKTKPDSLDCVKIHGICNNERTIMFVNKAYISGPANFNKYKLLISKANGNGDFGEALSPAIVAGPNEGHTQTFISLGSFETKEEALNLEKYIKTKFVRCMLSILKTTPDNPPYKWQYVPLQDFTPNSDINWNLSSIREIDKKLYQKYGLEDYSDFIENNVQEMD